MFNNYLSTIPQVADKLRKSNISGAGYKYTPEEWSDLKNEVVKGLPDVRLSGFYSKLIDRENILPSLSKSKKSILENANPADYDYRNRWYDDEVKNVINGLESQDYSKKLILTEKQYPVRNKNSSAMVFQTSQNMPSFGQSKFTGGSDITESSKLSDQDFNIYRENLLKNRFVEYENLTSQIMPSRAPSQIQDTNAESTTIDFILSSIEEKIGGGIVDSSTYNDLMKLYSYYTGNIWKFEDSTVLINLIRRLENIAENSDAIIKNKEGDEVSGRNQKDIQYAELFSNTIEKLITFINENIAFIGRNTSERKILSSALSRQMTKPSKNVLPSLNQALGQQDDEATAEAPELPPPFTLPASFRPSTMANDELKKVASQLGIQVFNVDSKDALKTLIWNQMNPDKPQVPLTVRQEKARLKNPSLYGSVGIGEGRRRKAGKGGSLDILFDNVKRDLGLKKYSDREARQICDRIQNNPPEWTRCFKKNYRGY